MTSGAVLRRLRAEGDPVRARGVARFFKTGPGEYGEGDRFLGITVPVLRTVTREYEDLPLAHVARLLKSSWHEARIVALLVLVRRYPRATTAQQGAIYRTYLAHTRWINNWDLVDCSAPYIVGPHLPKGRRGLLRRLARSRSLWERRIAVLSTFHYIKGRDYADALAIARTLLSDPEDLIHKAVGWMLREVGNRDRAVEERFLKENAGRMPRTMLRYAIERFPELLRRRYLAVPRK